MESVSHPEELQSLLSCHDPAHLGIGTFQGAPFPNLMDNQQSTCTEVHTRRRSFTSQIPAAAMPTAGRTVFSLRQFACPTTQGVSGGWKAREESLQHRRLENIWQFFCAKMMAIHALACSYIGEYVVLEATALARGHI